MHCLLDELDVARTVIMTNGVLAGKSNWNPIKHRVTTAVPALEGSSRMLIKQFQTHTYCIAYLHTTSNERKPALSQVSIVINTAE